MKSPSEKWRVSEVWIRSIREWFIKMMWFKINLSKSEYSRSPWLRECDFNDMLQKYDTVYLKSCFIGYTVCHDANKARILSNRLKSRKKMYNWDMKLVEIQMMQITQVNECVPLRSIVGMPSENVKHHLERIHRAKTIHMQRKKKRERWRRWWHRSSTYGIYGNISGVLGINFFSVYFCFSCLKPEWL